jgi:hypothetical protein
MKCISTNGDDNSSYNKHDSHFSDVTYLGFMQSEPCFVEGRTEKRFISI